jgi:hypothetical protein
MQTFVEAGAPVVTVEQVLASLRKLRVVAVEVEYALQEEIAKRLAADSIPFAKEYVLGPRNRIDFLVQGGIGIEAKMGKPNSGRVGAQVERYAAFPQITAIILVVERSVFHYRRLVNGKPVHYISLSKLWGIAL